MTTSPTVSSPATQSAPPESTGDRSRRQLKQTARGGLWNLAGAAGAGAGGLLITWLVAYALPPETAGAFFTATSAFLIIAAIARLGTPTGLVYWVARLRRKKRFAALSSALWLGIGPITILACALSVAAWIMAPVLSQWWSTPVELIKVLAIAFPAAVLLESLLAATRGFNYMRPTVFIDRLGRTAMQLAALAIIVVAFPATATHVTAAWAWPFIPATVVAAWYLRRQWQRSRTDISEFPDRVSRRAFWTFTAPRALASVGQLALQRLDIIMVGALLGLAEAAIYTVATRFVIVGQMAASAIGTAIQPRIAAAMAESEYGLARQLYQASTAWIVALTWPAYLGVAILVDWYLQLFGAGFVSDEARIVVWILASAMLVAASSGVVDSMLAMAGKTSWQLYNVMAALVVNIGLNVWLIPLWGITGAAVAWAAALLVNNAIPLLQLTMAYRLHPFGRDTVVALVATAVVFGLVPAGVALVSPAGWGHFTAAATLFLASTVWLSAAWRLRRRILLGSFFVLCRRHHGMRADYTQVFQDPAAVKKYEEATYAPGSFSSIVSRRQEKWLRGFVNTAFPLAPVHHDFACGTGRAIRMVNDAVVESHGYDTSEAMLAKARQVGSPGSLHLLGETGPLPHPSEVVSEQYHDRPALVTAFRILLNVDSTVRDRVMRFAAEMLPDAKAGLLVVENHGNASSLRHLRATFGRVDTRNWFSEMSHDTVRDLLQRHGFELVARQGFTMVTQGCYRRAPLSWVSRAVDEVATRSTVMSRWASDVMYVARRRDQS